MEIDLQTHEIELPDNAGSELKHRFAKLFSRMDARISRLHVVLKDINGPKGGRDKVCILRAELADGGELLVRDRSEDLRHSIDRCVRRAKEAVIRSVKRRRARHRQKARSFEAIAVAQGLLAMDTSTTRV